MKQTLLKRGIDPEKNTVVIHNWIDEEKIFPQENRQVMDFKQKYGLLNKFVIMYSGNIGLYYDLENIIKVIGQFNNRKDILFAFVGEGARKKDIENWVSEHKLNIVKFIPSQDKDSFVYSLNAGDVQLIANSKGIKGVSVPSKIYGAMAVGKFIIGIQEKGSEAEDLIHRSGCGIVVESGDYPNIYLAIETVMQMEKEELKKTGMLGRQYLEKNLNKGLAFQKYREMFKKLC